MRLSRHPRCKGSWTARRAFFVLNLFSALAVIVFVGESVFSSPSDSLDSYYETIFVGLCYLWGAFSLVYHGGVLCGENMRIIGVAGVFVSIALGAVMIFVTTTAVSVPLSFLLVL